MDNGTISRNVKSELTSKSLGILYMYTLPVSVGNLVRTLNVPHSFSHICGLISMLFMALILADIYDSKWLGDLEMKSESYEKNHSHKSIKSTLFWVDKWNGTCQGESKDKDEPRCGGRRRLGGAYLGKTRQNKSRKLMEALSQKP